MGLGIRVRGQWQGGGRAVVELLLACRALHVVLVAEHEDGRGGGEGLQQLVQREARLSSRLSSKLSSKGLSSKPE